MSSNDYSSGFLTLRGIDAFPNNEFETIFLAVEFYRIYERPHDHTLAAIWRQQVFGRLQKRRRVLPESFTRMIQLFLVTSTRTPTVLSRTLRRIPNSTGLYFALPLLLMLEFPLDSRT